MFFIYIINLGKVRNRLTLGYLPTLSDSSKVFETYIYETANCMEVIYYVIVAVYL